VAEWQTLKPQSKNPVRRVLCRRLLGSRFYSKVKSVIEQVWQEEKGQLEEMGQLKIIRDKKPSNW
jgi:hypothetical protein